MRRRLGGVCLILTLCWTAALVAQTRPSLIGNRPFCSPIPGECPATTPLWAGSCRYGGNGLLSILNSNIQKVCASACACDEWSWSSCLLGSSWQPQAGYHAACTASLFAGSFKASWMGGSKFLDNVPLNRIPLAGTHDSATYSIPESTASIPSAFVAPSVTIIAAFFPPPFNIVALAALSSIQVPVLYDTSASISPDQAKIEEVRVVINSVKLPASQVDPAIVGVTSTWARAQGVNILQQLNDGVRYLDLRVGVPGSATNASQVRIVHGLFGTTLTDVLDQVRQFYTQPSSGGEIVILDFQDMSNLNDTGPQSGAFAVHVENRLTIQRQIVDQLWQLFGTKLAVPSDKISPSATYGAFRAAGYNIIVLFRGSTLATFNLNGYGQSMGYSAFLWNRDTSIANPYSSTNDTVEKLVPWLVSNYSTLNVPNKFTVLQGINASTAGQMVRGFVPMTNSIDYPNSLKQASYAFTPVFADAVLNNPAAVPPPAGGDYNIVIGDWYHLYPFTDNLIAAAQRLGATVSNPYNSQCIAPNFPHLGCMPSGFDFADACNWLSPGSHVVYTQKTPAQDSWSCTPGGGFKPPRSLVAYCQSKGFGASRPTDYKSNFDAFGWYCCKNNTADPASCKSVVRTPQPCDSAVKEYCSCMHPGGTCANTTAVTPSCTNNCAQVAADWVATGRPAPTGDPFQDRAQCQIFEPKLTGSCGSVYSCLWGQYECGPNFIQVSGSFQLLTQVGSGWNGMTCVPGSATTAGTGRLGPSADAPPLAVDAKINGFTFQCKSGEYLTNETTSVGGTPTLVLTSTESQAAVWLPIAATDGYSMWLVDAKSGKLLTANTQSLSVNLQVETSGTGLNQLWRLPDSPPGPIPALPPGE